MTDIMDHVYRGAALLDSKGPRGWRELIDLEELAQEDVIWCVLGQVYKVNGTSRSGYDFGKEALGLSIADAGSHGFTASHTAYSNVQFTKAWKRYLTSMPPAVGQPELVMTRDLVKKLAKRFRQIDNPENSLLETAFEVDGIKIVLK